MNDKSEIDRLKTELARAYRALHGFHNAHKRDIPLSGAAAGYHSLTIAAAARFVREQSLEGSEYFVGKSSEVLRSYLVEEPTP